MQSIIDLIIFDQFSCDGCCCGWTMLDGEEVVLICYGVPVILDFVRVPGLSGAIGAGLFSLLVFVMLFVLAYTTAFL